MVNDQYRWKARLQPALLVLLPGVLAAGTTVLWLLSEEAAAWRLVGGTVASFLSAAGLVTLVEQLVRAQGKKKEPALWKRWGGAPATRMLRHRETELSTRVKRSHYHQKLKRLIKDIRLPSEADEERDPKGADHVYERCVEFLRGKTRDQTRFRLLFQENINYGFCRNLWAMWPVGLLFSAAGSLATAYIFLVAIGVNDSLAFVAAGATVVNVTMFIWWILKINRGLVFIPAKAWSERLFEALDDL